MDASAGCANDGSTSIGRCSRCRLEACDGCMAFLVNDEPWCRSCRNTLSEGEGPRWVMAGVVLGIGFLVTVAVAGLQWQLAGRIYWILVAVPIGGTVFLAARIAFPTRGGDAPRIVERARGEPLPTRKAPRNDFAR